MQKLRDYSRPHAIWLFTGLFGAVILVISAFIYWEIQKANLTEVQSNVQQALPRTIVAVNRALLSIDMLIVAAADQTLSELHRDPLTQREQLATILRQLTRTTLFVREIALLGPDGVLHRPYGARVDDQDSATLRRFAHNTALSSAVSQLSISEPITHFQNADSVILMGKKINLRDHEQGVLVVVVQTAHLSAIMGSAAALPGSTIVWSNQDFASLATFPDALVPRPKGLVKDSHFTTTELLAVSGEAVARSNEVAAAAKTLHADTSITVRYPLDQLSQKNLHVLFWIVGAAVTLFVIACFAASASLRSMERVRQSGSTLQQYALWLNEALQTSMHGMLLCDAGNKIRVWNTRFIELFPDVKWILHDGLDFQTMLDTIQDADHGNSTMNSRKLLAMELRASRALSSDPSAMQPPIELVDSEGNVVSVQTVMLSDGATVSTFIDVTEMDAKLKKSQQDVRAEFSKRTLYLREFSNRIAEPINTIAGCADRLRKHIDNAQDVEQSIALIAASTSELLLIYAHVRSFEYDLQERLSSKDTGVVQPSV